MARFRQRFSVDQLNAINETICEQDKKDDDGPPPATSGEPKNPAKTTENKDKLIMDATCVSADIRFVFFSKSVFGAFMALFLPRASRVLPAVAWFIRNDRLCGKP